MLALQDIEKIDYYLKKAELILHKLFKTTKEPKLLKEILINIYLSHKVLVQNYLSKKDQERIIDEQLIIISKQTFVEQKHLQVIKDVYELRQKEESCVTEFTRREALILCDEHFNAEIITYEDLELFIHKTKKLLPLLYRGINND